MAIEAWFDGVCEPKNPGGHAAYGVVVKVNGATVFSEGVYVGQGSKMSNNVAEYRGAARAFQKIQELMTFAKYPGYTREAFALVRGDSKLVVEQLLGRWEVRGGLYLPYYEMAFKIFDPLRQRIALEWIPREQNSECDELSKQVLRDRGIRFRIQPDAHVGAVEAV